MTFKKINEQHFPDLKITLQSYEHLETGALHYHTIANTIQNSFNITFKTLPKTNNGVAHILEHSVLNGSKKYPISSLFFALQGKNFDTLLNAQTSLDSTQYLFSSLDEQGFMNILDVYLDATFFPRLDKMTFLREGWRYEFKDGKLNYTGVVFNEMKGAYSSAMRVAFMSMINKAFKNTHYQTDSGGYPLDIPNLSYEDFKNFHKTYYHPSNTIFYSYGSIDVNSIQAKLENDVLSHFNKKKIDTDVNFTHFNSNTQVLKGTHPAPDGQILIKAYALPSINAMDDLFQVDLLLALLKSGKTDMSQYLLNLNTNLDIQLMTLLEVPKPTLAFIFTDKEINELTANKIIQGYFDKIKKEGFEQEGIDNLFNTLELSIREDDSSQSQKGLSTFSRYQRAQRYGIKNMQDVHNLELLHSLKAKMLDKNYVASLIDKFFLSNQSTISYISIADPEYSKKIDFALEQKLNKEANSLTPKLIEEINEYNRELNIRTIEDDNTLPKLTLNDINIKFPKDIQCQKNEKELYYFKNENKVSYFKCHYSLNHLTKEELYNFNLASSLMSVLPIKGMNLEQSNLWKETSISELDSSIKSVSSNLGEFDLYAYVEAKSLSENSPSLFDKVLAFAHQIDFNQPEIIQNTVESMWNSYIASYQDNASKVALLESQSQLSKNIAFKKEMNFDFYQNFIFPLLEKMKEGDLNYLKDLKESYQKAFLYHPISFYCGEEKYFDLASKYIEKQKYLPLNKMENNIKYELTNETETLKTINMNVPVSNVAYTIKGAFKGNADLSKLQIVAHYINDYLLSHIREKNGAYGAQASVFEGGFTMLSYRDPNPQKSVEIMHSVGQYLIDHDIDIEKLNSIKLALIKEFNKPYADIELVERRFNRILNEKEITYQEIYNNIMSVTPDDIKNISQKYFIDSTPSIAITTNQTIIDNYFSGKKNKIKHN